jgi:hypothetical protein
VAAEFKVAEAYADFTVKVEEGLDKAVARIKARAKELDTTATVTLDADTAAAKAKIKGLGDTQSKVSVKADADTTLAKAKLKELEATDGKVKIKAEVDQPAMDKAGREVEESVSRVAKRANAQFSALTFAGLSLGLPAAATIGVAGAGLALAALPGVIGGVMAEAASHTQKTQMQISNIGSTVAQSFSGMVTEFEGPVSDAVGKVGATFGRLRPQIESAVHGSADAVSILAGAGIDFAENVMPGIVAAVASSKAPLEGLRSLTGQVGAGLSDMFIGMTSGAQGAGAGLSTLGGILQDALGFVGQFLGQLAQGSAGPMSQFQAMMRGIEDTLMNLTATGSGAMGFLSGFTGATTGAITILSGLAAALSALPPQVSQFSGSFVASGMILSQFGINAGKSFEGLGAKIKAADGPRAAFSEGLKGLISGALSPATLATAGLALGLEILGQKQRDAAAAAQAQRERVSTLAQALRESNGAINENVTATAAQALQQFKVSDGTRNLLGDARSLGLYIPQLTAAYLGNKNGLDGLNQQIDASIKQHTSLQLAGKSVVPVVDEEGKKYQQFRDIINSGDFDKAVQSNKDLAQAAGTAKPPMSTLAAAMEALKDTSADATGKVDLLHFALDVLTGRSPEFEAGIKAGNDALRGMADKLKDGKFAADGFGKALLNSDGTIRTVTKNGSDLQGLATGLQSSFLQAGNSIEGMVAKGMSFGDATKKVTGELTTQRTEFVKLAEKMGLSAVEAGKLADKYGLIPETITTNVTANIKQAQDAIDAIPDYAKGTQGAVIISATTDPATGKINEVVHYADGSTGVITVDGMRDPATNEVLMAVQFADGSTGTMTVDAYNQAAKDKTLSVVRYADGSIGTISVHADTSQAGAAVQSWMDRYIHAVTIPVRASVPAGGILPLGANAVGGLVGGGKIQRFADGGFTGNGPIDVSQGGRMRGPGTGTSDSMIVAVSNTEAIINAKQTANNVKELSAINSGFRNYEKYPDTGRPPVAQQLSAAAVPSTNVTINVYAQPGQDLEALASMVSRELYLRSA